MTYNQMLMKVRDALTGIEGAAVFHYTGAVKNGDPYIVWMEDGEDASLEADNRKQQHSISGTVDLYTKTEFDPLVDSIHDALNTESIGFYLNSVQYEDDTGYIHYEWVWSVS